MLWPLGQQEWWWQSSQLNWSLLRAASMSPNSSVCQAEALRPALFFCWLLQDMDKGAVTAAASVERSHQEAFYDGVPWRLSWLNLL
jgi:hypothetical protein